MAKVKKSKITDKAGVQLLPCPFCSGKPNFSSSEHKFYCNGCGATTGFVLYEGYFIREIYIKAADEWNKRAFPEGPKWTTEPPTEEGWYLIRHDAYIDEVAMLQVYRNKKGKLAMDYAVGLYQGSHTVTKFCTTFPGILWLKLNIPALPEEGNNNG